MLAMGVSFTSCRDHDEELIAELYGDVRDAALEDVVAALQDDKSELGNLVNGIVADALKNVEQCECNVAEILAKIDSLEKELANIPAGEKGDKGDQGDKGDKGDQGEPGKDADYEVVAKMLADSIAVLQQELQAELVKMAENFATIAQLNEVKDAMADMRLEFVDHVDAFLELQDFVEWAIANLKAADENFAGRLNGIDATLNGIDTTLTSINTTLTEVKAAAVAADALSKANQLRIDTLFTLLEDYNVVDTAAIWTEIRAAKEELVAVREEAQANLVEAKAYADSVAGVVKEELTGVIDTKVGDLEKVLKAAEEALQGEIDALKERVDALEPIVEDLTKRVEALEDRMDKVEEFLEEQITNIVLNGAYSPVVGYFNLPNGTKSNILAAYYGKVSEDFKFPTVDWADNGVTFDEAAFEALGFAEKAIEIKNNKYGVLVAEGANAGKVYMTINPAEVSLEGKTFSLVNSLDEQSPAEIINVKQSTEKLAFGYTRAGAVALYEGEARIENAAAAKIRMELSDLKDALVDVVKFQGGVNVTNLVTDLYALVNNIADANAVKATWTDSEGEAHTVYSDYGLATVAIKPLSYNTLAGLDVQSVPGFHRGMNLVNRVFDKVGTISIPDLGLSNLSATLESINFGGAIGEYIEFDVKYSDVIKKKIPFQTTVDVELPLNDIVLNIPVPIEGQEIHTGAYDLNGDEIIVKIESSTVNVDYTIKAEDIAEGSTSVTIDEIIEVEIPVEFEVPVKIATKDVLGDLGGTLDSLDDLIAEVNGMLADVNGKIESVEDVLNTAKDKVQNGLNKYLDKLNRGMCKLVNSFNDALQPTMLVSTTDGFARLSSIKGAPTTIDKASAVFVPTSFTAEILAPAYQKFVAVTKAYDANGNEDLDAAKAANTGDFATVLPGGTRAVQFNGKSGYTYEVTYSAIDFSGFIANTKYYVRVK